VPRACQSSAGGCPPSPPPPPHTHTHTRTHTHAHRSPGCLTGLPLSLFLTVPLRCLKLFVYFVLLHVRAVFVVGWRPRGRLQSVKDVPPGTAPKAMRLKEAEAMGKFDLSALGTVAPRPVPKTAKEFVVARNEYEAKVGATALARVSVYERLGHNCSVCCCWLGRPGQAVPARRASRRPPWCSTGGGSMALSCGGGGVLA
jgi:hypothetical protein